jgi:hypothetical protein
MDCSNFQSQYTIILIAFLVLYLLIVNKLQNKIQSCTKPITQIVHVFC